MEIVGWPWAVDNFSWVEPTSWACVALRAVGQGGHERVREGQRMCSTGPSIPAGQTTATASSSASRPEPIPGPTALRPESRLWDGPRRDARQGGRSLSARATGERSDLEHLGMGKLALDLYRDDSRDSCDGRRANRRRLRERKAVKWLATSPLREAPAVLASEPTRTRSARPLADAPSGTTHRRLRQNRRASGSSRSSAASSSGASKLRAAAVTSAVHIARAADYDADLAAISQKQYEHFRATCRSRASASSSSRTSSSTTATRSSTPTRGSSAPSSSCASAKAPPRSSSPRGRGTGATSSTSSSESGLGDVLDKHGVPFVDINHDEPVKMPNLGRLTGLEYLYLSRTVATADVLISLPKLKTHHWAGGDAVAQEPVRHAAGHLLRLAEERAALARHRTTASSTSP